MLPGVTGHDLEGVLAYGLAVVGIELEGLVEFLLAVVGMVTGSIAAGFLLCGGVHRLLGVRSHVNGACGIGVVDTEVEVEAQVLETVHLVVNLHVSEETVGAGKVLLVIEQGNRVLVGHGVAVVNGEGALAVVPPAVAVQTVLVIYRLGRSVLDCLGDGIGVCEPGVHVHRLAIQVEGEMLVQEGRSKVEGNGLTAHIAGLQGTLLIETADGNAVWHADHLVVKLAGEGSVQLIGLGETVDFLLPVGVDAFIITEGLVCIGFCACILLHSLTEFSCIHNIHEACILVEGSGEIDVEVNTLSGAVALLGGDEDDTVGSPGAVDCGCGSVLQDGEALDIVRVD